MRRCKFLVIQTAGASLPQGVEGLSGGEDDDAASAASGQQPELSFKPEPHRLDDGLQATATSRKPMRRRLTANLGFDGIEFGDPTQSLSRDRRVGGLRHLVEPSSGVRLIQSSG
jgi:hypothetical protein